MTNADMRRYLQGGASNIWVDFSPWLFYRDQATQKYTLINCNTLLVIWDAGVDVAVGFLRSQTEVRGSTVATKGQGFWYQLRTDARGWCDRLQSTACDIDRWINNECSGGTTTNANQTQQNRETVAQVPCDCRAAGNTGVSYGPPPQLPPTTGGGVTGGKLPVAPNRII